MSLTWAGPVTHTGAHATDVVRQTVDAITGQAPTGPAPRTPPTGSSPTTQTTPRERLDSFVAQTLDYRAKQLDPDQLLVPHAGAGGAEAGDRPGARRRRSPAPVGCCDGVGLDPVDVNAGAKVVAAGLMQVLPAGRPGVAGAAQAPALVRRPAELAYLSVGAVAALGLIVARAQPLGRLRRAARLPADDARGRAAHGRGAVAAAAPPRLAPGRASCRGRWRCRSLLLLVLGGALPMMLGGNEPRLALGSSGTYYDRFYTSDAEEQAIDWLARHRRRHRLPVQGHLEPQRAGEDAGGDRQRGSRRRPALPDAADPRRLRLRRPADPSAGRSTIFYTGDLITYRYPTQVLDRRMNLVYSAPDTRIYR